MSALDRFGRMLATPTAVEVQRRLAAEKDTWQAVTETFGSRTITNAGPVVMASAMLPALKASGGIRISGSFEMDTAAHNRTALLRIGGQSFSTTLLSSSGVIQQPFRLEVFNNGSQSSQRSPSSFFYQGAVGTPFLLGTVDMSQPQLLEVLGTVATYSMTLLWLNIETRGRV